jgi:uncharacterized membrane protein YphA (DoxX/SURF4 family)
MILLGANVAVGAFFALSGWHKLTRPKWHSDMVATLKHCHIPRPRFMAWWVSAWELIAGLGVASLGFVPGLLAWALLKLCAVALIVICIVACSTDGFGRVRGMVKRGGYNTAADRLDDWLYLPETLYLVILVFVVMPQ